MKKMYLDIDHAFSVWLKKNPNKTKGEFLEEIPLSWQTAGNLQKGVGKQKQFAVADRLKKMTGESLDNLIKQK